MRSVVWLILLFVAAVVAAAAVNKNDGLVSIFYEGYRVDTSLNVAVIALVLFVIVLYGALKAINGLLGHAAPGARMARAQARTCRARGAAATRTPNIWPPVSTAPADRRARRWSCSRMWASCATTAGSPGSRT